MFPPTAVSVFLEHPHGSPRNVFAVTVRELEPRDDRGPGAAPPRRTTVLTADVTAGAVGTGLSTSTPAATSSYAVKATAVTVYPADPSGAPTPTSQFRWSRSLQSTQSGASLRY